ncbi:hypothetical protein EB118_07245 [bacterium]|nr:hypothetical protein [bacterium]NDC94448.1 hypothetical protein [bacterium]NDD84021.1 hypothetical protein [bacterium]NDG29877.1 hypothetical protein [bacterium]
MKVFIFASDVASYIGQNKWDYLTPFERLWKKCDTNCYNELVNQVENKVDMVLDEISGLDQQRVELQSQLDDGTITDQQYLQRRSELASETNNKKRTVDNLKTRLEDTVKSQKEILETVVGKDLVEKIQVDTQTDTREKRNLIEKAIEASDVPEPRKRVLQREAESFVNKSHGTLKEMGAIEIFCNQFDVELDTSQTFFTRKLPTNDTGGFEWYIGGKLDGIHKDYIVEVKNRTQKFFNRIREYEKTQIHMYMYITQTSEAKLVESLGDKIRVTHVMRDPDYLDDILQRLVSFLEIFENEFLRNIQIKTNYVEASAQTRKAMLGKLFFEKEQVDAVCLI